MRRAKFVGLAAALAVHLLAVDAAAEPAPSDRLRMRAPSSLTLPSGRVLELPPGRYIAEPTFEKDEIELKRLQELEVRLTAENTSLRKSAEAWRPGWVIVVSAVLTGISIAVAVDRL